MVVTALAHIKWEEDEAKNCYYSPSYMRKVSRVIRQEQVERSNKPYQPNFTRENHRDTHRQLDRRDTHRLLAKPTGSFCERPLAPEYNFSISP